MMTIIDTAEKLLDLIKDSSIWIYGAGHIGSQFADVLIKHGLSAKIKGYVVSNMESIGVKKGVYAIDQVKIKDEDVICVAVHDTCKNEIISILEKRGHTNYIWVYPFLYDLMYGNPIFESQWIYVYEVLPPLRDRYGISIRWSAIDEFYGKNNWGFDIYRKAMAPYCTPEKLNNRVEGFKKMIADWEINGYDERSIISINKNYEIIDGEHRVTLAIYHGQDRIKCRIYDGNKVLMTEEQLIKYGFQEQEIDRLTKINEIIEKRVFKCRTYDSE